MLANMIRYNLQMFCMVAEISEKKLFTVFSLHLSVLASVSSYFDNM